MIRTPNTRFLVSVAAAAFLLTGCLSGMRQKDLMHVDCMTPPDPGPCKAALAGYYYDYQSDRCRRFTYGGCGGSRPFESMDACVQACGARTGY